MGETTNSDSDAVVLADESNESTFIEDSDPLSKALDGAIITVSKSLSKAKSSQSTDNDDEDEDEDDNYDDSDVYDDDDDDEEPVKGKKVKKSKRTRRVDYVADDEPDFSALSKSIPDAIGEDDAAAEVLDAMPLVAAIADALEEQMTAITKAVVGLTNKVERLESKMTKSQKLDIATAEMLKSVRADVKSFGDLPLPKKSIVNSRDLQIMKKSGGKTTQTTLSKIDAMTKLSLLCKSGRLSLQDATMAEARIQKGINLPDKIKNLLLEEVA